MLLCLRELLGHRFVSRCQLLVSDSGLVRPFRQSACNVPASAWTVCCQRKAGEDGRFPSFPGEIAPSPSSRSLPQRIYCASRTWSCGVFTVAVSYLACLWLRWLTVDAVALSGSICATAAATIAANARSEIVAAFITVSVENAHRVSLPYCSAARTAPPPHCCYVHSESCRAICS